MLPRRPLQVFDAYPWSTSEIAKRGVTAPKPKKTDQIYIPNRIPTSSSKYVEPQVPNMKVSIKGSGWRSYKPREPVRLVPQMLDSARYRETRDKLEIVSPSPDVFEHIWEEGSKRPKTQNEKCRKKGVGHVAEVENGEIFPGKNYQSGNCMYDVPVIVIRDDKSRRVVSAKRNGTAKGGKRPATFKPGRSTLVTSLDQDFLDLFEV